MSMRILLITDEIWNDLVFGNNVLSNWFDGMQEVEFAQICATPGRPYNKNCTRYFQITDKDMVCSLVGKKAGVAFESSFDRMATNPQQINYIAGSPFYSFMKKISGTGIRLIRELIWQAGRFDTNALEEFVHSFNPDVVFCPRLLTWKLMRIEKLVRRYTDAPFVAFTGDDEASFREVSYSPLFWGNIYLFHKALKSHAKIYGHYFMHSLDQAKEYLEEYGVETSSLFKCGDFDEIFLKKEVGKPIRMVYAGRLYCNRWKSLAEIGKALKIVNREKVRIVLDIYTQDVVTKVQKEALCEQNHIYLKGSVTAKELREVYRKADIALHVESLDKKYRLRTRVSFSTKIIDLLASSCAVMAICWEEHTGYKYLKDNDAAFCIASYDELLPKLTDIADNPELIQQYAEKAYNCGITNHSRERIQGQIIECFKSVIAKER